MCRALSTILVAVAALSQPAAARAEIPATSVAQVEAAFADFDALSRETLASGALPSWSAPKDHAILTRLVDPGLLGAPPYSAKDLGPADKIFSKERAVYGAYLDSVKRATPAQIEAKSKAAQDVLLRLDAFFIKLQAVELTALADFVAHLKPEDVTEVRLKGLRQMRLGITQIVSGALMMGRAASNGESRAVLVAALADNADAIATGLPLSTRAKLADEVRQAEAAFPTPDQARLRAFASAMASPKCEGLCTIE